MSGQTSLTFSLEATEETAWMQLLGRGEIMAAIKGTWVGTVAVQRLGPNDVPYTIRSDDGGPAEFTGNTGVFKIADAGPVRFSFTRDSGTAEIVAWSDQSLIYMPFTATDTEGMSLLWMSGEPWAWMSA